MNIEAMAPVSGVERLMIDNVEHFRLIDVARAHPNLQPDYRWPHVFIHDQAMSLLRSDAGIVGVRIKGGSGAQGYFIPLTELPDVDRFFASSKTRQEAYDMRWKVVGAARAAAKRAAAIASATLPIPADVSPVIPPFATPIIAAPTKEASAPMTPIAIYPHYEAMQELRSSDLPTIRFAAIDGRLFWVWGDLANAVCNPVGKPLCSSQYRRDVNIGHDDITRISAGKRGMTLMLADARVNDALEGLSKRPDYDRDKSRRVQQRMQQLATQIGPELADKALEVASQPAPEADVKKIVTGVMGADLPFVLPPATEGIIPPIPQSATEGIEILKTIQFDPKSKADQLLERMAASERAQLKMAEAMDRLGNRLEDAVDAIRSAQAGIERRDEQIASLERLIALAGQHLTRAVRHHS